MEFALALAAAAAVILIICIIRAVKLKAKKSDLPEHEKEFTDEGAVERFQAILRKKTVWPRNGEIDYEPFDEFLPLLKELYPRVFEILEVNIINNYGILLRWKGETNDAPAVLMAHYDVVAADETKWSYPPYAAEIHDGKIFARGAMDTKCIISGILEAADYLMKKGYTPKTDIWFSFTNNEETGGDTTPAVVEFFKGKGIKPRFVLDEGGAVADYPILGIKNKFAMIGVVEKGICDTVVTVEGKPGHSSTPCPTDPPTVLAKCLNDIGKIKFKARLAPVVKDMFTSVAAYAPFGVRFVIGNLWLFSPLVKLIMTKGGQTNAFIRTTVSLTMLEGSDTINVIPPVARAGFSVRIAPWDTSDNVLSVFRKKLGKRADVSAEYIFEPSPVSDYKCEEFNALKNAVLTVYPQVGVAPLIMTGGTDSKHFARISPNVYRFAGFCFTKEDMGGMHGNNETLGVQSFLDGIDFYIELLRNL